MRKFNYCILIGVLFCFLGCEDILEKDISQEIPINLFPEHGEEIAGNTVNFSWEPLNGAEYRVQVFSGQSNSRIALDTLISYPYFSANLVPEDYKWRIRYENSAYAGPFSDFLDFLVVFSEDLSRQNLLLETPNNNLYTNKKDYLFTWFELTAAESYTFRLQKKTGTGTITVDQVSGIQETYYQPATDLFDEDAEYVWSVKGENSISSSDFSSRTFFLDTTDPGEANLTSPDQDEKFGVKTITFSWELPVEVGLIQSQQSSILEISSEVNFENIIEREEVSSESQTISFEEAGTYYWRVQVKDRAGNYGEFSETRSIIID